MCKMIDMHNWNHSIQSAVSKTSGSSLTCTCCHSREIWLCKFWKYHLIFSYLHTKFFLSTLQLYISIVQTHKLKLLTTTIYSPGLNSQIAHDLDNWGCTDCEHFNLFYIIAKFTQVSRAHKICCCWDKIKNKCIECKQGTHHLA